MDARTYLRQCEKIDAKIKNKMIERQQWREMALSITANTDGDGVHSSGSKSKMANAIDRCIDMEGEIDALVDELVNAKREVIAVIEQLDNPTEYNVLHMRYIQKLELQEIADAYKKEYGWVTTVHGRALKSVQEVLDQSL